MRKNIAKFAAVGLSLALVVTSVNLPSNTASAAAKKAKLSATKKTITAKKSATLKLKKKKGGATIKLKSSYVKVSTSKKSVATIKAVKKSKKVVSYKVSAKKAGKATITIKVKKGTYKGTYKCKVTVKAAPKVTPKPTAKPTAAPTNAPSAAPTDAPTEAPTDAPTEAPTDAPTEAPTEEPTATPVAVKATVVSASNITKDGDNLVVALTLQDKVTAEDLKGAKITLTGAKTVTATFKELNADGKAVFVIDDAAVLMPGDTTANGEYKITSDSLTVKDISTVYEESLAGNAIEGYVLTDTESSGAFDGVYIKPVAGATVKLDSGETTVTDSNGFYRLPTVGGRKMMTVTKDGYVTKYLTGTDRVYVNKSHVTSQNISIDHYDATKLGVILTVQDAATKAGIKNANVILKNASGDKIAEGVTSSTGGSEGKITFANHGFTGSVAGTDKQSADAAHNYLSKGKYTLEISKKLSKTNVDDVYATFTKEFTIEDDYENVVTAEGTKTAAIKSFEVTQNLKEKAEAAYIDPKDDNKMKATYALYTQVDGNSLDEPVMAATAAVSSAVMTSSKTAVSNIFDALKTKGNNGTAVTALTLPTGTYYLLITPAVPTAAQADYTLAYAVVKVDITAGGDVKASADLTEGNVRTINTQVTLPNKVSGTDVQKDASLLKSVYWDAANKVFKTDAAAPFVGVALKSKYSIKQVVGDVAIKIVADVEGTSDPDTQYKKGTDGAYASTTTFANFLGTGTYMIESVGDYTSKVPAITETINNDKGTLNFKVSGAANPVQAEVKVTEDSALKGLAASTTFKATKVVAYDTSGKAVETLEYTDKSNAGGSDDRLSVTVTAAGANLAKDDKLVFTIPGKMNLPAGTYTFGITLDGYKEVKTDSVEVNAIEMVGLTVAKKLEKAAADANSISGEVKLLNENGKGYVVLDNTSAGKKITGGTVVLLTADKKIAAISDITWNSTSSKYEYSLVDGMVNGAANDAYAIKAGAYKMVVRANETETKVIDVTVTEGKQIVENIDMVPGALGEIKAFALDNNNKQIKYGAAIPMAFDEWFVNPQVKENYVTGKAATVTDLYTKVSGTPDWSLDSFTWNSGSRSFGAYKTISTYTDKWSGDYAAEGQNGYYVFEKLPVGKYTVNLGISSKKDLTYDASDSNYSFKDEIVNITDIGNVVKQEWTYAKAGETADEVKVPLTINLKGDTTNLLANNKAYVVKIEPVKGAGTKTITKVVKATAELVLTGDDAVTAKTEYKVSVYTYAGFQVGTATINVERAAATVEVALNASNID